MNEQVAITVDVKKLDALVAGFPDLVAKAVAYATHLVELRAKQKAPVDTGFLRNSIRAVPQPDPHVGAVYVGAEYAIYLEFGTVWMLPRPFLTPALESARPELEKALASAVARLVP